MSHVETVTISTPSGSENVLNPPQSRGKLSEFRYRPFKGSKARPPLICRPTLRKVQVRLRALRNMTRSLRGALYKTRPSQAGRQAEINQKLVFVQQKREEIMRYWGNLTAVD